MRVDGEPTLCNVTRDKKPDRAWKAVRSGRRRLKPEVRVGRWAGGGALGARGRVRRRRGQKRRDRPGAGQAIAKFGVSARLAVSVALAELATALARLPHRTAQAGAGMALLPLEVFSAAIAWNLARDRRP